MERTGATTTCGANIWLARPTRVASTNIDEWIVPATPDDGTRPLDELVVSFS